VAKAIRMIPFMPISKLPLTTGTRKVPHGSITINTPAIYLESESDNAYQFLDDLKEKIERVEAEAIAYLKGEKRGSDPQQALNFESNGNEKSGPVAEEVTEEATA
jgi:hypothetical protein